MKKITPLIIFLIIFSLSARGQGVTGYTFAESTETYTAVAGTNATATGDDGTDDNNPIGFSFNFGGLEYTTFSISTNGFIRLGSAIGPNNWINQLSNNAPQAPFIAAFWDDHNRNTGAIQYLVTGVAPSRILHVGWNNINISNGGNASVGFSGSFKMRLYETTGQIDFVYGPQMTSAGAITASIGINDMISFMSVTPAAGSATVSSTTSNDNINATSLVVGRKYTFIPQPQCIGAPTPGNTVCTVSTVCADVPFILSLQNPSGNYGLSYQWQTSATGVAFIDIPNATGSTLATTQNSTAYYQCAVTCSGTTTLSNPVQVVLNAPSACYCFPTYDNGKTDGDLISNVVISGTTLANNTGNAPINPYYTYFTGQANYTAVLDAGLAYDISITVGTYGQQNVSVWIDYNDDFTFAPDEKVGNTLTEIDANGTGVFTITLACDPPAGVHRMRIRDVWNTPGDVIDPCANYGYGEVEDYDITINAGDPCQQPYALAATNVNSSSAQLSWIPGCGQISWDVHVTAAGGGLPSGTPSHANASNPLILTGLTPFTNYEYYVMGYCGANGSSTWAGPFAFSTLPMAVPNDECETAFTLTPGGSFDENAMVATNVGATKTIGPPNPTCATFAFGGDVWFSIVVPFDGNITIETQSDPGSPLIDTGLSVFTGTCGAGLTALGCSDDEGIDAFSRLDLSGLTPGSTIYARVWEYANDTFGTFRVSAWSTSLGTDNPNAPALGYYPNPVKDFLNFSFVENISWVKIFNLLGQEVMNAVIDAPSGQINLSSLPKGTYMVKVNAGGTTRTLKIIKE